MTCGWVAHNSADTTDVESTAAPRQGWCTLEFYGLGDAMDCTAYHMQSEVMIGGDDLVLLPTKCEERWGYHMGDTGMVSKRACIYAVMLIPHPSAGGDNDQGDKDSLDIGLSLLVARVPPSKAGRIPADG